MPPCSCCAQHKYHRYWFNPWHLCCETRLLQRKRLAGNFPPCDSPLLFAEGACAQNQEEKKERPRGRAKQEGDGKMIRKHRGERGILCPQESDDNNYMERICETKFKKKKEKQKRGERNWQINRMGLLKLRRHLVFLTDPPTRACLSLHLKSGH